MPAASVTNAAFPINERRDEFIGFYFKFTINKLRNCFYEENLPADIYLFLPADSMHGEKNGF